MRVLCNEIVSSKIAKAVFVAATMLTNGQNILDMFSNQAGYFCTETEATNLILLSISKVNIEGLVFQSKSSQGRCSRIRFDETETICAFAGKTQNLQWEIQFG